MNSTSKTSGTDNFEAIAEDTMDLLITTLAASAICHRAIALGGV